MNYTSSTSGSMSSTTQAVNTSARKKPFNTQFVIIRLAPIAFMLKWISLVQIVDTNGEHGIGNFLTSAMIIISFNLVLGNKSRLFGKVCFISWVGAVFYYSTFA